MSSDAIVPLMHAIVAGIREDSAKWGEQLPDDWESFALVIELRPDGRYADSYGYAYGADDAWVQAIAARPRIVKEPLTAFIAERYPDGATPPVSVLFQLALATGNYNVEYEDTDRSRWQVSPENHRAVRAELKPVFED